MSKTIYLDLEEVIAIHHELVSKYGGSHGIRDLDLLLSAVSRPRASFSGVDLYPSIFLKSASLMHSMILNHPFIDGNKRTGITSATRLLFLNGFVLKTAQKKLVEVSIEVAKKEMSLKSLSSWLKRNSRKI